MHDFIKVTAGKGLGDKNPDFDIEKWNACTVKPEYSASLKRFTVNIQHDVASLLNLITSSNVDTTKCIIELSACLGNKDWHSTIWRSGTSFTVSGDYASIKDKNIVCNWDKEVTKEELEEYGNKFFSGAIFSYTTDIGFFSKEILSEQMIYRPNTNADPSKFYVGNWESNYFWIEGYVVYDTCEIRSDGTMSPRMYEREGSAFDVDINDVAGVYKAEEGTVTINKEGTFEASVGEDYGMYVPGIVFVSGYKFVKQSN